MTILEELYQKKDIEISQTTQQREQNKSQTFKSHIKHDMEYVADTIIHDLLYPSAIYMMKKKEDTETKRIKIWTILQHPYKPLKTNIQVKTLFIGFWKPETKTHDIQPFRDAGTDVLLNVINDKIKPMTLENISDRTKSFKMVFELVIPAREFEVKVVTSSDLR